MELSCSIILLPPGMHILRHPKNNTSALSVARAAGGVGSTGKLEILATPNTHGTTLRDGSDCIVMHVIDAPVEILVTAYINDASGAAPALRVDRIALDLPPSAASFVPQVAEAVKIEDKGMSVIAHIEKTGDVVVGENQRAGVAGSNLRIEGFQIMWPDRPKGVDLAYGVSIEGVGALPTVTSGAFCGTRGEGRRITEIRFALTGPDALRYALEGAAHFSGGFQMALNSGIALSGPSGFEHLTGLAVRVVAITPKAPSKVADNPWDESPQTKVFKAVPAHRPATAQALDVAAQPAVKAKAAARPSTASAKLAASAKAAPVTSERALGVKQAPRSKKSDAAKSPPTTISGTAVKSKQVQ